MANYNKVLLMGNLTRDPQLRYIPSTNTPVVDFGIAVNRRFKSASGEDREETTFVDCSAFAKTAELINQYFNKGKPIFVEGRLKLDQWEDKQGGGKRSKLSVVVEGFQFVGGRDSGGGAPPQNYDQGGEQQSAPRYQQRPPANRPAPPSQQSAPQQAPPPEQPQAPFGEEQQFKDDDIPF